MPQKRVRVGVKYGDTSVSDLYGQNYTYLVDPRLARVGQKLTVQVNNGHGLYTTTATVVTTDPKSGIRHPRIGR